MSMGEEVQFMTEDWDEAVVDGQIVELEAMLDGHRPRGAALCAWTTTMKLHSALVSLKEANRILSRLKDLASRDWPEYR